MAIYISILRGINVSGQKKIQMKDLVAIYESLGFTKVVAYIQSGNVVFNTSKKSSPKALAAQIEKGISDKYGFEVPVLILTHEELKAAALDNPFIKKKDTDLARLYITFLAEEANAEKIKSTEALDFPPDQFIIKGKTIYLYCPVSYGNSKLSNNFFENKLKVKATTRNWNTVNKLIELSLTRP